ncbi:unnamed protein product, partial [Mesorhabditis belari]|uniref:Fucosyltransferase N-terminal domain-containing protein n=1 Tax=Mesorhabditis belari TaxID=2138241 RepID=A0AAF3ECW6_9BILA
MILYYTKMFSNYEHPNWVHRNECANLYETVCVIHSDRRHLNTSDAVIFEPRFSDEIDFTSFPRKEAQIFVFSTQEAPVRIRDPHFPANFFNATMTHLTNSDVHFGYRSHFYTKEEALKRGIRFKPIFTNWTLVGKRRMRLISGAVSNCDDVTSGRKEFLDALYK